ncbi:MAG: hypothetical protein ABIJ08_07265 [Nanoarchaeota archaeon]
MRLIAFLIIVIMLSSSCLAANYITYTIDDSKPKQGNVLTFNVYHKTGRADLSNLIKSKESKRKYNIQYSLDEKKLNYCLNKITKNWKRDIAPNITIETRIVKGYQEDLDKNFKRDLWFRIRRGEKVC